MGKDRKLITIDSFFKRKESNNATTSGVNTSAQLLPNSPNPPIVDETRMKAIRCDVNEVYDIERDPGKRPKISDYPPEKRDEIRRAYLKVGPYQIRLTEYPKSGDSKHLRRFQESWYTQFSSWLEYSPSEDAAYCLPCYLFTTKPVGRPGWDVFSTRGFKNWKKVNDGKRCAFLTHVGEDPLSPHNKAVQACEDLLNQSKHIDKVINAQSREQILNNRLRVKTSIDAVLFLSAQGCAFRGHDETNESHNQGNFIELIKLLASYDEKVAQTVLDNAPQNAKYTSPTIQRELLQVIASKVRSKIRDDVGDSKFCIIVDEARDESKREQMALVLRFVDKEGFVQERFFGVSHVPDTAARTLKDEICVILSRHSLDVQNIRGQGYDGASNMRGEWKGLQALFINDCPYAYYVHCFAHRLQLTLVAAAREVISVHQFFTNLSFVINVVGSSSKRHDQLQDAQMEEITYLLSIDELQSGKGANQLGTLARPGDTRWSSHFHSLCSLLRLYGPTIVVLDKIENETSNYSQRGDANAASKMVTSFEFVFILHLMKEIMGITNDLCQALQKKNQDILNAMHLVSDTKVLLQNFRETGWKSLLEEVVSFCSKLEIDVPDLAAPYFEGRSRRRKRDVTVEHHFHNDIFVAAIDVQMMELNCRFGESTMELLTLSHALDPKNGYKSFNIDSICMLAEKYYPADFTDQDRVNLRFQLRSFEIDVHIHPELQSVSSISELCRRLVETERASRHYLIDRLLRLVLTLPVSTATGERAFSAMKILKTRLRNRMEDDFLEDNMTVYIEKDISKSLDSDCILNDFVSLKERRVQF